MSYVYVQSEQPTDETTGLWTVGHYRPDGKWIPESDHDHPDKAAERVHYLNGAGAVHATLDEALNTGDGSYRP